MEKTRVADVATRHCGKLSKGYRQRVGLAQAILHNPEVLILDEPTAGLDPKQIMETRDLIKGLAGDHTIVLSTHILPEVSQICQRVVIINKGRSSRSTRRQPDRAASRARRRCRPGRRRPQRRRRGRARRVPGVAAVTPADKRTITGFEIECQRDRDIRRDLAHVDRLAGAGACSSCGRRA